MEKDRYSLFLELPEGWKERTWEIFKNGGVDVEAYTTVGITKEQHAELLKIEEYATHFDNGMAIAEAWWANWARMNIALPSKEVNTKLFETVMGHFFKWNAKILKAEEKAGGKKSTEEKIKNFEKKFKLA